MPAKCGTTTCDITAKMVRIDGIKETPKMCGHFLLRGGGRSTKAKFKMHADMVTMRRQMCERSCGRATPHRAAAPVFGANVVWRCVVCTPTPRAKKLKAHADAYIAPTKR